VARYEQECHDEGDQREGERDEENGSPVELGEQRARDERPERSDRAAQRRPERNRLRPTRTGPQCGDQSQRRRVCHTGREPASHTRHEQHFVGRSESGQQRHGDSQRGSEDEHHLPAVAIAERAEVEHGGCEAERIADRDEVERDLRRVERLADVRQRDVRDREVQVRDRRYEDEGDEHDARTIRGARAGPHSIVRAAHSTIPSDGQPSRVAHRVMGGTSANPKRRNRMEEIGPVEYMIVSFPGNRFTGEIAPALGKLVESNTIRIIDLAFVGKDDDGTVAAFELSDIDPEVRRGLDALGLEATGLLGEEDLMDAAADLEPGSSAAMLLWEDIWAAELAGALRGAGGELVAIGRIPHDVVMDAREALLSAANTTQEG
jgi:hypothetical protein